MAFLPISLFLERFWCEFRISSNSLWVMGSCQFTGFELSILAFEWTWGWPQLVWYKRALLTVTSSLVSTFNYKVGEWETWNLEFVGNSLPSLKTTVNIFSCPYVIPPSSRSSVSVSVSLIIIGPLERICLLVLSSCSISSSTAPRLFLLLLLKQPLLHL